jgi:hypothetical protein
VLALSGTWHFAVGPLSDGKRKISVVVIDNNTHRFPLVQDWTVSGAPSSTINAAGAWFATGWNRASGTLRPDPLNSHETSANGRGSGQIFADPIDPQFIYMYGDCLYWRSTNGGRTWECCGFGFHGVNPIDVGYCRTQPSRVVLGCADIMCMYTGDGWNRSVQFKFNQTDQSAIQSAVAASGEGGSTNVRGMAVCILPHDSSVSDPAARGRVVGAAGGVQTAQTCFYWNPGASWFDDTAISDPVSLLSRSLAGGGGVTFRRVVDYDFGDPMIVYNGRNRSNDGGATYNLLFSNNRLLLGVSRERAGRIYTMQSNYTTIEVSTNAASGTPTFSSWFTASRAIYNGPTRMLCFALSPHDDELMVVAHSSNDIALVKNVSGVRTALALNLLGGGRFTGFAGMIVQSVVWCTLVPTRIYATVYGLGFPRVWQGDFDAGFTSVIWTDVTFDLSRAVNKWNVWQGPAGEVIAGGGNGTYILPPPEGIPTNGNWRLAPKRPIISY